MTTHMTGPEHYREGERLLAAATKQTVELNPVQNPILLALLAQAHFQAALVIAAVPVTDDA